MGADTGFDSEAFRFAYDKVLAKWPAGREALTVATPFGDTRVNTCGPRDAPSLLLLPGGGGATSVSWYAQVAGLARVRRVHAVDVIGAPGLSVPAGDRHPRTVADRVLLLVAANSRTLPHSRLRSSGGTSMPRAVADRARALLPHVETAVLPEVSHHALPQSAPGDLAGRLIAFLTGP
ncbi:hypothetical protein ACQPXS_15560 [Streptomyces sp. CA-142005]|uniref:hypothetical protein n=1 Tax=Streptomyces sp. CA-142005 TaxID=3240052 RepID=UPI003D8EB0C7